MHVEPEVLVKSITSYTPPAYPCPSPWVTFSEPLGQAGAPTTAGVLGEDVEATGAGVLVLATGTGLEELAGVAGALDEADDPQAANARVAKQASAAAAHLVRVLPSLRITAVPSVRSGLMPLCHYDDGEGAPVA